MRGAGVMWLILAITVCVSLFLVKHQVQSLEDELNATRGQIAHERSTIRVLNAEWVYLNDPERLRRLSARYLGFVSAAATKVTDIATLPFRGDSTPVEPAAPDGTTPVAVSDASEPLLQRTSGRTEQFARTQRFQAPASAGVSPLRGAAR